MPPRSAITSKKATALTAKKRKNADRSDEEQDSDFDYAHNRRPPQRTEHTSKINHQHRQHAVPAVSSSDNSSANAREQKIWRSELSELKRAKRLVTEEDRGFVFTRKKTVAPFTSSSTAIISSKSKPLSRDFEDAENPLLGTPIPPPTPEGTPSRDKMYGRGTKPPKTLPDQLHQPRQHRPSTQHTPERNQETIVTIPMRETPMIKRNKDIRNASRRSSFNLRGKRASSIGNGFAALPHPSIDSKSFFRHIAAEDPPPVRMKQLMAWCARKTIDSQKSTSQNALKIAKLIEEETLALLLAGKFSVSWYSRPTDTEPIRVVPKKPHQQNVENNRKLKECEAQIARLRKEDDDWTAIISSFNTFHASLLDSEPTLPPGDDAIVVPETFVEEIDIELLSADERSLWEKHCTNKDPMGTPGPATKTINGTLDGTTKLIKDNNKWMLEMMGSLEKEVDNLQDTLYAASRFDKIAKQYTDQVLEQIATALDERQRPVLMDNSTLTALSPSSFSAWPTAGKGVSGSSTSAFKSASAISVGTLETKTSSGSALASGSILAPSMGLDIADDPRQILRALSRLSL
ncbi:hypothetical protein BGZ99_003340 [Dissophora globulifera]|uniref:Uncharacterized protein n=1 Tax=Dissophora globulifera TaxID=979702 RepID=A0A9P6RQG5_9FUNG|nr:hypothetical protein BGZ99_003340 [Dissophora globulifera]